MAEIALSKSFKDLEVLNTSRFSNQNPAGQGFGDAITARYIDDEVSDVLSSDGGIKVHNNGDVELLTQDFQYGITFVGRLGRTTGATSSSIVAWLETATDGVNFSQPANTKSSVYSFDSADLATQEVRLTNTDRDLPIGTRHRLRIGRLDTGADDGGLIAFDLSGTSYSSISNAPSATIIISKVVGI